MSKIDVMRDDEIAKLVNLVYERDDKIASLIKEVEKWKARDRQKQAEIARLCAALDDLKTYSSKQNLAFAKLNHDYLQLRDELKERGDD